MASKNNLDETRERLEIDSLDELSRKQLFNKFVEKGGTVVADNSQKTSKLQQISNKQSGADNARNYTNRGGSRREPQTDIQRANTKSNYNTSIKSDSDIKKLSFIKKMFLWLKAYSNGVIELNGKAVNYMFLLFINKTVLPSLIEISSLVYSVLYPADEEKELAEHKHQSIVNSFKDLNDYELLERVRKLYNKEAYDNILKNNNMSMDSASERINDFRNILKGLYIIRFYVQKLNSAISTAFAAHSTIDKLKKEIVDARVTTFNKTIDLLYTKYYDKLLILVSYVSQRELVSNVELNEFLQIKDEDILGYYVLEMKREIKKRHLEKKSEKESTSEKEIEKKKQEIRENKIISVGMAIIEKAVSFEKLENEKDSFYRVSEKDKIYKLKTLFDFFEREYGYVFISNRVKYAVMYANQKKIDYQRIFNDSFAALSDLPIKLNEYATIVIDMYAVENDEKMNFAQKSSIISERKSRLSYIARNIQNSLISIITPIKETLDRLLLNKDERDAIIENQNEVIKIDSSYLKKKPRIQNYTVIKAITEAYYFVSALSYLLTLNDLPHIGASLSEDDLKNDSKSEILNDMDNFISDMKEIEGNIETLETNSSDNSSDDNKTNDSSLNIEDINTDINIDELLNMESENNDEEADNTDSLSNKQNEDIENKKDDIL